MGGKPVGTLLLLLASGGCQACSSCCDYLPPVADGPYTGSPGRAGSAISGGFVSSAAYEGEAITPLPQTLPEEVDY